MSSQSINEIDQLYSKYVSMKKLYEASENKLKEDKIKDKPNKKYVSKHIQTQLETVDPKALLES